MNETVIIAANDEFVNILTIELLPIGYDHKSRVLKALNTALLNVDSQDISKGNRAAYVSLKSKILALIKIEMPE